MASNLKQSDETVAPKDTRNDETIAPKDTRNDETIAAKDTCPPKCNTEAETKSARQRLEVGHTCLPRGHSLSKRAGLHTKGVTRSSLFNRLSQFLPKMKAADTDLGGKTETCDPEVVISTEDVADAVGDAENSDGTAEKTAPDTVDVDVLMVKAGTENNTSSVTVSEEPKEQDVPSKKPRAKVTVIQE